MKPDRSNYELWSVDWLEGKLDRQQSEEFIAFLQENPDIREEIDGIILTSLKPGITGYAAKDSLLRSAEDLTHDQFENLCIGYLENDLGADQKSELLEIAANNKEKKRELELTMKLRLKSLPYIYTGKKSLKKFTAGQKIIRISIAGLSIAASVAAIIGIYLLLPSGLTRKYNQSVVTQPDTLTIPYPSRIMNEVAPKAPQINIRIAASEGKATRLPENDNKVSNPPAADKQDKADSVLYIPEINRVAAISVVNVKWPQDILGVENTVPESVLAYNSEATLPSPFEEDRSNVERFLARLFHEKIMKDKVHATAPVTSYDLAVAGLTGLNKLFGWELALNRNLDEKGEVRSYHFSSRLVKFNTPSKKDSGSL